MEKVPLLTLDAYVDRGNGFVDAEIDNEVVALSIEKGTCYGLNETGTLIWKLLATPIRVSDICKSLLAEYKVGPDECERDVRDLLANLLADDLIEVIESP